MTKVTMGARWTLPIFFVATVVAGCSSIQNRAASIGIHIEFPALEQLGYSASGRTQIIVNNTPFFAVVVVYDAPVALLRPGQAVKNTRHWDPLKPQMPVAVLFYREEALTSYVGCAGRVLPYTGPGGTTETWVVGPRAIHTPASTNPAFGTANPNLPGKLSIRAADFPTETMNQTTAVQIIDNTDYQMAVYVDGKLEAAGMSPGQYYYVRRVHLIPSDDWRVSIQLMFTSEGREIGKYDYYASIGQGVAIYQLIVNNQAVRR